MTVTVPSEVLDLDIISHITENFSHLRDAEKKVAQIILDDLPFAASASITELAEKAAVSEATITRFAKAMSCRNVRDLKVRLAQSLGVGQRFLRDVNIENSAAQSVYDSIKNALDYNASFISDKTIQATAGLLDTARQILIFGVGGGSTVLAQESQFRFFRLGYPVSAYSDPMLMRMVASTIETNDVVFCLSLTGHTPDVLDAVKISQQYGAKVIAVTNPLSPLGRAADILLPIETDETDFIFKPSAARYVMLAVIDIIATELATLHKRNSREKLRRLKHTLDSSRGGGDRLPLGD